MGRGGGGVHRRARRGTRGRRARPPVPRQHRALQAPQGIPLRRAAAEEPLRQGGERRVARHALRGRAAHATMTAMLFPGFRSERVTTSGTTIHAMVGPPRDAPALLLLHGYPQTHAIWHKVAPRLAQRYN